MVEAKNVMRAMKVVGIAVGSILVVFSVLSLVAFNISSPVDLMLPFYYM